MTYEEALTWLHSMPRVHSAPTLARTEALLAALGSPEKTLSGRFLHVTGTNGKGSACAFMTSVLRRAGYRVGRFISPFIMEFRERMEIDGERITEEEVVMLAEEMKPVVAEMTDRTGVSPLEFELVTAMGLLWFARKQCDLVVLEVGIGGTYDPTNVVTPLLSLIMRVDYDHTELLGNTLAEIAANKAGIIKPGAPCVLYADNEPEVVEVVKKRCAETGSTLVIPELSSAAVQTARPGCLSFTYRGDPFTLHLSGLYQLRNALCAVEAMRLLPALGWKVTEEDIRAGLAETTFPARFEVLAEDPPVILDGAHNGSGMDALRENIAFYFGTSPILCLCGMLRDKHPDEALAQILSLPNVTYTACITPPTPRAMAAEELAEVWRARGIPADGYPSIPDALAALAERRKETGLPVVCFGSLYSAGDVRRCFGRETEA